jgi:hypothetical protein
MRRSDRHLTWRLWEVCFGSQRPEIATVAKQMDARIAFEIGTADGRTVDPLVGRRPQAEGAIYAVHSAAEISHS